jgi:hypothetical protein
LFFIKNQGTLIPDFSVSWESEKRVAPHVFTRKAP